jgi:chromosome segregation ATPase
VSLADVDAALEQAQAEVGQLGGRLFELDAERERRADEADGLQGESAAEWQGALDQISVMWTWYQALSETVSSIAARRQSSGPKGGDTDTWWRELTGASIQLPDESIELARRCLPPEAVAATTWAIRPLVALISKVVETAAETVTSVLAIRDLGFRKLDEIEDSLAHSEANAGAAGVRVPNQAASVRSQLDCLRAQLASDPMAVRMEAFAQLAAATTRIREEIDESVAEFSGVEKTLDHIGADLEAARTDLDSARRDLAEGETKITPKARHLIAADADSLSRRSSELGARLTEARQLLATGNRAAATRLAGALTPAAQELVTRAATLAGAAAGPLSRRRELRGRLDAYRAKAHSLGRAEDPTLLELYRRAEDALYTAPCDLDEAERRLAGYQAGILSPSRQEGPA